LRRLLDVVKHGYMSAPPRLLGEALARHVARELGDTPCTGSEGGCCRVYLWAAPPRHCLDNVFFAVVDTYMPSLQRRLARLDARRLASGIYVVFRRNNPKLRAYVRLEEGDIKEIEPPCPRNLVASLAAVGDALSLRDAVDIVAAALGVSRREARDVLRSLAERACIEIKSNRVSLLD